MLLLHFAATINFMLKGAFQINSAFQQVDVFFCHLDEMTLAEMVIHVVSLCFEESDLFAKFGRL